MEHDDPSVPLGPPAAPDPTPAALRAPGLWRGWMSIVVGVAALLAIASYGTVVSFRSMFGHDNPEVLRAMKRDPIGAYVPPYVIGGASVVSSEAGEAMGQPSYARLYRSWHVPRGEARASFTQAVRAVKARGWRLGNVTYEPGDGVTRDGRRTLSRSVQGDNRYRTRLPLDLGLDLDDPRSAEGRPDPGYLTITISLVSTATACPGCG